jgi:hypothetical protein
MLVPNEYSYIDISRFNEKLDIQSRTNILQQQKQSLLLLRGNV